MSAIDDVWSLIEQNVIPKVTMYQYQTEYEYIVDTLCFRKIIYDTGEVKRVQKLHKSGKTFLHHDRENAFIRVYTRIKDLLRANILTRYEHSVFLDIATYIGWETQIVMAENSNVNVQELANELKIDRSNLMKCLKKFEILELVTFVKKKKEIFVKVNAKYASKGRFFDE